MSSFLTRFAYHSFLVYSVGDTLKGWVEDLSAEGVQVEGRVWRDAGLGDGDGLWVDHNYRIPVEEHQ